MGPPLLRIEHLTVEFPPRSRLPERAPSSRVRAVDGLSLRMEAGEAVALVGESGSGKSATALATLGLLDRGARVEGELKLDGVDVLRAGAEQLRRLRGAVAGFVFQEPGAALDPVMRAGAQVAEALRAHRKLDRRAARARVLALFEQVELPRPGEIERCYPHQLSGGMQQRVMIAAALAAEPKLLIADEPTTALDTQTQAGIIALLCRLRRERQLALLLISHDLALVRGLCERAVVMRRGKAVERGRVEQLLRRPEHPYTRELLAAVPRLPGQGAPEELR